MAAMYKCKCKCKWGLGWECEWRKVREGDFETELKVWGKVMYLL